MAGNDATQSIVQRGYRLSRRMTRNLAALWVTWLIAGTCAAAPDIQVDQRFELMSVVARLAGYDEYRQGKISAYNHSVDTYFAAFTQHPAVEMARRLRQKGIGYDALPSLAVWATDAIDFAPRVAADDLVIDDHRWSHDDALEFLRLMANFSRDTRAMNFFASQETLYSELIKRAQSGFVDQIDARWFEHQFDASTHYTLHVRIAPLNGGGNYGAATQVRTGEQDLYAFVTTGEGLGGDLPTFNLSALPDLVHEFMHSYVNPWVNAHAAVLDPSASALLQPVQTLMMDQGYRRAHSIAIESMVQAYTLNYIRALGEPLATTYLQERIDADKRGWYWLPDLAERLAAIPRDGQALDKKSGQLIGSFLSLSQQAPELYESWNRRRHAALEREYSAGPTLIASEPASGARLSSYGDPQSLVLHFDRPMKGSTAILRDLGVVPTFTDEGQWDADLKTFRIGIKLAPATSYRVHLNDDDLLFGFRDSERRRSRPVVIDFETR